MVYRAGGLFVCDDAYDRWGLRTSAIRPVSEGGVEALLSGYGMADADCVLFFCGSGNFLFAVDFRVCCSSDDSLSGGSPFGFATDSQIFVEEGDYEKEGADSWRG